MKEKISGLIRLQDLDNRIKDINTRKNEGPLKIRRLEDEFNKSEVKLQEDNNRLDALKKDRRKLEQDVQDLENSKVRSQIKLSNIKSNKEYTSVLKEIDTIDKGKTLVEDNVLQLMEEIEELENRCQQGREEMAGLKRQFDSDKNEIEEELEFLDRESAALEKQRKTLCEEIDQDLLNRYNFLKDRKAGVAIGSVIDGVCQACFMGIPPQKYNELIKCHSLMTCPNCNRFIYWGGDKFFTE